MGRVAIYKPRRKAWNGSCPATLRPLILGDDNSLSFGHPVYGLVLWQPEQIPGCELLPASPICSLKAHVTDTCRGRWLLLFPLGTADLSPFSSELSRRTPPPSLSFKPTKAGLAPFVPG